jgi:hypothetical protein
MSNGLHDAKLKHSE